MFKAPLTQTPPPQEPGLSPAFLHPYFARF
nr:MAG TPA: hypothetical protein [Bacteriophage sp.]